MLKRMVRAVRDFVNPPTFDFKTDIRVANMREAFDALDAGDYGRFECAITLDNILWWLPCGRILKEDELIAVGFQDRNAALMFKLTFGKGR